MAAKRIIAGLTGAGGMEAMLARAHRLAFEGADEICLTGVIEPSAIPALVAHLDLPVVVSLSEGEPAQIEALFRLGACRIWLNERTWDRWTPLLATCGALRLGVHLGANLETLTVRAEHLLDAGLCEVIAPLSLLRESDLATRLPMQVVAEGQGESLEAVVDWLLSGGDGWLREPDSSVSIPALKQALRLGGLRIRT